MIYSYSGYQGDQGCLFFFPGEPTIQLLMKVLFLDAYSFVDSVESVGVLFPVLPEPVEGGELNFFFMSTWYISSAISIILSLKSINSCF
jgi:hypothetical protein